ncbi:hypothetical protein RIF29_24250 [Crotalaria pallida]|uniref:F-box domain-containing protein n=1 Tax=Crotalaria pallida TaxID=3830 RepID=A0AAN9HWE2_CROPI
MSRRNSVYAALNCDDILFEILLRLPPSTIYKSVIVSKNWLCAICSPRFRRIYLSKWGQDYRLLGFFVCNFLYLARPRDGYRRPHWEPALPFLSTCRDGDDLTQSRILRQLGYFIDSSNGIILAGRHPKTYFVYNNMTRQQYPLPEPQQFYKTMSMAFIVEEYLDDISYKVIRAKCESRLKLRNTVSIETFSSKTGKWKQTTLMSSTPFALCSRKAGAVVGGVVHWFAIWGKLAIYDPRHGDRHIALVRLPVTMLSLEREESILGESSDGLLQFGSNSSLCMELWVLEKEVGANPPRYGNCTHLTYKWIPRFSIFFKTLWKQNASLSMHHSKDTQLLSFLPRNSKSVFIRSGWNIFLYDLETKTVELVHYQGRGASISWESSKVLPYFLPSWPSSIPFQHGI